MKSPIFSQSNLLFLPGIILLLLMLSFSSCQDEVALGGGLATPDNDVLALLTSGTWEVSSVTVDGTDYTGEFEDFIISFSEGTYSSANATVIFGGGGQWTLEDDGSTIVLGSGLELNIRDITSERLVFEFQWDTDVFGKSEAVAGKNVFTLTK